MVATLVQISCPFGIVKVIDVMGVPIDFHHDPRFVGSEIGDKLADHLLPAELYPFEPVGAQRKSHSRFRFRPRPAVFAGELRKSRVAHSPLPTLSPEGARAIYSETPKYSATEKMSLSPRPHKLARMISSLPIVGASFFTAAIAWAGSSAGMMPSVRQSN